MPPSSHRSPVRGETPAHFVRSRDHIRSIFALHRVKEEQDAPDAAATRALYAIPEISHDADTSTAHEGAERDDELSDEEEDESRVVVSAALEHSLQGLGKFAPDHKHAVTGAVDIVEQKLLGTPFLSPLLKPLKSTAKWVKKELEGGELSSERRRAIAELIRHSEADIIAQWLKSALKDQKTLRGVGTILAQIRDAEEVRDSRSTVTKRTCESQGADTTSDRKRSKRIKTEAPEPEPEVDNVIAEGPPRKFQEEVLKSAHDLQRPPEFHHSTGTDAAYSGLLAHSASHHQPTSSRVHVNESYTHEQTNGSFDDYTPWYDDGYTGEIDQAMSNTDQHDPTTAIHTQTQHTTVPYLTLPPEPKRLFVYLPISTPEMPITNPTVTEVEDACRKAIVRPNILVWVQQQSGGVWVACIDTKGQKNPKCLGRALRLKGHSCRLEHLPSERSKAFFADFTDAVSVPSSEIMHHVHAALPGKQIAPELVELTSSRGKKARRHFQLHFISPPAFMRLYVSIMLPGMLEPFIAVFAPMRPTKPCIGCGKSHGTSICTQAQVVPWPN